MESLNLFNEMEIPRGVKRRMKERLKRLDADNALNHDFFWTDPMPCSLDRMLSNHGQSMFEYTAPARRGGRAMQPQPMQQPAKQQHNEGYMDRVF